MSTTVDQRVVEMQFDNKQFEQNVQTSMNTLSEFKKSLQLDGATKGINDVEAAARNFDMSGMNRSIETVKATFSSLQVIGATVLSSLTQTAMTAGKKMANALTSALTQGGWNRAKNIEQAKFQLEGLGYAWEDVSEDIDYAVKGTAYGLDAAAKACSQLVASNVEVGDSMKTALRGISGVAAMTNSSYEDISHVFTRVAGNGRVFATDLQSIASRGLNAAAALGKYLGKTEAQIREMVSDGQIDFATFAAAMDSAFGEHAKDANKTFTGALSNMKAALSRIGADVAGPALTNLRDVFNSFREVIDDTHQSLKPFIAIINKIQTAAAGMVVEFVELEGLHNILAGIGNIFKGIWSILKPIKEVFTEIFPPKTAKDLANIAKRFAEITSKFKLSNSQATKLKNTFRGLFTVLDIFVTIVKKVVGGVVKLAGNIPDLVNGILTVTSAISEWLTKLNKWLKENDVIAKTISTITDILQNLITTIKKVVTFISTKIAAPGFEMFLNVLKGIWNIIQNLGLKIAEFGANVGEALASGDATRALGIASVFYLIREAFLKCYAIWCKAKRYKEIFDGILGDGGILGLAEKLKSTMSALSSSLWELSRNLKYDTLMKIAQSLLVLSVALLILSSIDSDKLAGAITAITSLFIGLYYALDMFQKIQFSTIKGAISSLITSFALSNMTNALIEFSVAILVLTFAFKQVAKLDWDGIWKGLVGIAGMVAMLTGVAVVLSKTNNDMVKGLGKLILFAVAIKVLASACEDLSTLNWDQLLTGLLGVGTLMGMVGVFMNSVDMSKGKKIFSTGAAMVLMGVALKMFATACKDMAQLNWREIGKGLAGVGALLLEIGLFTRLVKDKNLITTAAGMVIMGKAMDIFVDVMRRFSGMQWNEMGKGLAGLGGALGIVALAINLLPNNTLVKSAGLLVTAGALTILSKVLEKMSNMSWTEIGKGLATLGGSLAILATGLFAMKGSIAGSAALLVAVGALNLLVPVIKALGSMSWESIGKSLVALAGAFVIVGVAATVASSTIGAILSFAGAIALIGLAVGAVGISLAAAGAGLTAFASAGVAGATALVASLSIIITGVIGLIPAIVKALGDAIVSICEVIVQCAPAIGKAIKSVVILVLDILLECVPRIAEGILKLIVAVMGGLVKYIPKIVDLMFDFFIKVLDRLADRLPDLVKAFVNLLDNLFVGAINALKDMDPDVLLKGVIGLGLMTALAAALAAVALLIPAAMVGAVGLGVLMAELAYVIATIGAIAQLPGFTWLVHEGSMLMEDIGNAIGGFVGGIVNGFMESATNSLPDVADNLSDFMTNLEPFISGLKKIDPSILDSSIALAGAITAITASKVIDRIGKVVTGGSDMGSFGEELAKFGEGLLGYYKQVKSIKPDIITASASAASALVELSRRVPNRGGVASWFAGENSIAQFGDELKDLAKGLVGYSQTITAEGGFDGEAVKASVLAADTLVALANKIPNTGGMKAWFVGDNSIAKFGEELEDLAKGLSGYSQTITAEGGFDGKAVTASVNAGNALVALANNIPKTGGVKAWFAGNNSISTFGKRLKKLAKGLRYYSDTITEGDGFDAGAVTASTNAGNALVALASRIPNSGGIKTWFTGDNNIADFGKDLKKLAEGLRGYSDAITEGDGFNAVAVTASTYAAQSLVNLANKIPNAGGMKAWFVGDNSIAHFGNELKMLGSGLRSYSDSITEGNGFNGAAVVASTFAAQSIAALANNLPKTGGLKQLFTGEQSLTQLAYSLAPFGQAMKAYSDALVGSEGSAAFNPTLVTSSANAALAIAGLVKNLPSTGGLKQLWTGAPSLASLAPYLSSFGTGMKAYSDALVGTEGSAAFSPELVTSSATAALALAELANNLPKVGGLKQLWEGAPTLESIVPYLAPFGKGMKAYSDALVGGEGSAGFSAEAVTASATAAKALGELANNLPTTSAMDKLKAWISGEEKEQTFIDMLVPFAKGMRNYSKTLGEGFNSEAVEASANAAKALSELSTNLNIENLMDIFSDPENTQAFLTSLSTFAKGMRDYSDTLTGGENGFNADAVTASANAGKTLSELASSLGDKGIIATLTEMFTGENSLTTFAASLPKFGESMVAFSESLNGFKAESVTAVVDAANKLAQLSKSDFGKSFKSLGTSGAKAFVDSFNNSETLVTESVTKMMSNTIAAAIDISGDVETEFKDIGKDLVEEFADSLEGKKKQFTEPIETNLDYAVDAAEGYYDEFYSAGEYVVKGFAAGIDENTYAAKAKATAMAKAAYEAAKEWLDINSPSKVFRRLGLSVPEGFAAGITKLGSVVANATYSMGDTALSGTKSALARIADAVNGDIDTQPTIRPVLDLSDVKSGVGAISGMFDMNPSVGVLSNVRSISSMMNKNQNGSNEDIVSALNDLKKSLSVKSGDTFNINGVSYSGDGEVANAIKVIARAAMVERRV